MFNLFEEPFRKLAVLLPRGVLTIYHAWIYKPLVISLVVTEDLSFGEFTDAGLVRWIEIYVIFHKIKKNYLPTVKIYAQ